METITTTKELKVSYLICMESDSCVPNFRHLTSRRQTLLNRVRGQSKASIRGNASFQIPVFSLEDPALNPISQSQTCSPRDEGWLSQVEPLTVPCRPESPGWSGFPSEEQDIPALWLAFPSMQLGGAAKKSNHYFLSCRNPITASPSLRGNPLNTRRSQTEGLWALPCHKSTTLYTGDSAERLQGPWLGIVVMTCLLSLYP